MRPVVSLLVLMLGACATTELPVAIGHPADPNAPEAPSPASLGVLGSAFSPDALTPKGSSAQDPHEHHRSGGHAH